MRIYPVLKFTVYISKWNMFTVIKLISMGVSIRECTLSQKETYRPTTIHQLGSWDRSPMVILLCWSSSTHWIIAIPTVGYSKLCISSSVGNSTKNQPRLINSQPWLLIMYHQWWVNEQWCLLWAVINDTIRFMSTSMAIIYQYLSMNLMDLPRDI